MIDDAAVKQHFGMVNTIARRYYRGIQDPAIDYDDLFSEGLVGLVKALKKFDPSNGYAFSTFAYPTIAGYILSFLARKGHQIRFPAHSVLLGNRIIKANFQDDDPQYIAQTFGVKEFLVKQALDYVRMRHAFSLDKPQSDSNSKTPDPESDHHFFTKVNDDLTIAEVNEFLQTLPEKKRKILELKMEGLNKREIATIFKCSHQAIFNQIQSIQNLYGRFQRKRKIIPFRKEITKEMNSRKEGPDCGLTKQQFIEAIASGETTSSVEKAWGMKYNTLPVWVGKWGLKGINTEKARQLLDTKKQLDAVGEELRNQPAPVLELEDLLRIKDETIDLLTESVKKWETDYKLLAAERDALLNRQPVKPFVFISRAAAEIIQELRDNDWTNEGIISTSVLDTFGDWDVKALKGMPIVVLSSALINGYEIEPTPEEKAIAWLRANNLLKNDAQAFEVVSMLKDMLGGTIHAN